MSAKGPAQSQGFDQRGVSTITEEQSTMRAESSIAYPPNAAPIPQATWALFVACIGFSTQIAFCWRFSLMSFHCTYYSYVYFVGFLRRRRSSSYSGFVLKGVLHGTALSLLTLLCTSITPIHVVVPTLMDLWTPYTVHPALRTTNVMHDAGPSAELGIFAIHGLGSNPDSAWAYRNNQSGVHWLRDLLPEEPSFQNTRVVMVNHHTRWDSNTAHMGLQEHASELLESIQSLHRDHPERPIIFIAHSFGGLLLKKALLLAKARSKHVAEMTRGIIFLGVPHRGTHAAIVASCLSWMSFFRGSSSSMLELMAVDGPALLDLESEFYDSYVIQHRYHEIQPYICDVFELRPERLGKLVLGSIVRPKYGHLRHGRLVALDTDHRGLNKFQSSDDPNWRIFLRVLRQARDHALYPFYHPLDKCSPAIAPVLEPSPVPGLEVGPVPSASSDIITVMVEDAPYLRINAITSAYLGLLQEWAASWLAKDRNKFGNYFTSRCPKSAKYSALIKSPLVRLQLWLVGLIFSGRNSVTATALRAGLIMLIVLPLQVCLDQAAMALIAGARTRLQVSTTVRVGYWRNLKCQWILILLCSIIAQSWIVSPDWWPFLLVTATFTADVYGNASIKKKRLAALRKMHFGSPKVDSLSPNPGSDEGEKDRPLRPSPARSSDSMDVPPPPYRLAESDDEVYR